MALSKQQLKDLSMYEKYSEMQWFVKCHNIKSGQSFGKSALITGKKYTQSFQSLSNTILATVDKDCFKRILQRAETRQISKKLDFLAQLPLFKYQSITQLKKYVDLFIPVNYRLNHFVHKQDETP